MNEIEQVVGRGTILVVDDEEIILDFCCWMVRRLGFDVLKARNGQEATDVFARYQDTIDLVILDIQMPVMDGERTYELLKQIAPDVKVILISGYSRAQAVERMLQDGCKAFIQKPFNIKDLSEKIEEVEAENFAQKIG